MGTASELDRGFGSGILLIESTILHKLIIKGDGNEKNVCSGFGSQYGNSLGGRVSG
jgi:hypothetical protein